MEATVLLAKCPANKRLYGMRTQKMSDGDWVQTWAFAVNERGIKSEGYDRVQIKGSLGYSPEYPGCPYCRAKNLVQCGRCGKLSCWTEEAQEISCQWCGFTSRVERVSEIRVSGGDM